MLVECGSKEPAPSGGGGSAGSSTGSGDNDVVTPLAAHGYGNFITRDLTGDGEVDIFTTNKRGTFLHVRQ
jgi:hypothetical protein